MTSGKRHPRLRVVLVVSLCLVIRISGMASQACGSEGKTVQGPFFFYAAWTEPVAGGLPVVSHSIYLASDGTLQYARFTDRGDLLKLERGNCPALLFKELTSPLAPWLGKSGKPGTAAAGEPQGGPAPIAVDFQAPRITVALSLQSGRRKAESWPEGALPPELAPLIERARDLAGRRRDAAHPGSYIRLEPAMVQRVADIALEDSDLRRSAPLAEAFLTPWRFVPAREPIAVRRQALTKDFPLFVALMENLFLLRAYVLAPAPSEPGAVPVKE